MKRKFQVQNEIEQMKEQEETLEEEEGSTVFFVRHLYLVWLLSSSCSFLVSVSFIGEAARLRLDCHQSVTENNQQIIFMQFVLNKL